MWHGHQPVSNASAKLLGQLDDDAFGAADVAEPIAVLVLLQLANEFGAVGVQAGEDVLDVFDGERMPGVFAGAFVSALAAVGVWNFVSSNRLWPSGVRATAMSARTPSSPTTRSIHRPSTGASPSSSRPSSTKKAVAAARSSTTTPTWSIRRIVTCPQA
jgi:hypothetical protein